VAAFSDGFSMKARRIIGVGTPLLLVMIAALLVSALKPPVPVAFIRVVDVLGRPIEGAVIAPDGLRPKKGGGHYMWSESYARSGVRAVAVTTDAEGYARVAYPFYTDEKLETGEISFLVDHPDYCADRPFRVVAPSPPANAPIQEKLKYLALRLARRVQARPDPVALKRGGIVMLTGYIGERRNIVTNLNCEISNGWPGGTNFWRRSGPMLWSKKVGEGAAHLRAVSCPAEGGVMFSGDVSFTAKAGETNEFELELKPGARVAGRLNKSVPRPARNGRVCIHVYMEGHDGNSAAPIWYGWRPVDEDGVFVFESLPKGRLEIIGLCDGFVSQDGQLPLGRTSSQRLPQSFTLDGRDQAITLAMEPAASCEVTVRDDTGRPLAGATAGFWPNVLWGGNGSTIFASGLFNSEDFFRGGQRPDWAAVYEKTRKNFHAESDANGVAVVWNLPAGEQSYSVRHTNYDMPIVGTGGAASRSASVKLSPGETGKVAVTMQVKGKDALTH
jgi:hypothetical protein